MWELSMCECKVDGKKYKYIKTLFTWRSEKKFVFLAKSIRRRTTKNIQDFSRVVFALGKIPNKLWLLQLPVSMSSRSVVCYKLKKSLNFLIFFRLGLKLLVISYSQHFIYTFLVKNQAVFLRENYFFSR